MQARLPIDVPGLPPEVTAETLLELEGLERTDATIYLSGSLVEGLGNRQSDMDIFVVGEAAPRGELVISKSNFRISVQFLGHRRVDYEYWPRSSVEQMRSQLAQIHVGHDFVAEKLDPTEELFIHRLAVGVPLRDHEGFQALRDRFDFDRFRRYLSQQAVHRVDGAIEDVCGMSDDNDHPTGVLRARDLVGLAVDVHLHAVSAANPLPKWRARMLERLADDERSNWIRQRFWSLQFPPTGTWSDAEGARRYMEDCVRFANQVVQSVQQ